MNFPHALSLPLHLGGSTEISSYTEKLRRISDQRYLSKLTKYQISNFQPSETQKPPNSNKCTNLVFWLISKLRVLFWFMGWAKMSDLNYILVQQCDWVQLWFVVWWLNNSWNFTYLRISLQNPDIINTHLNFLFSDHTSWFKSSATTQIGRRGVITSVCAREVPMCQNGNFDCSVDYVCFTSHVMALWLWVLSKFV